MLGDWFGPLMAWLVLLLIGAIIAGVSGRRRIVQKEPFSDNLFTCYSIGYLIGSVVTFFLQFTTRT
jgi:hypothetical protein